MLRLPPGAVSGGGAAGDAALAVPGQSVRVSQLHGIALTAADMMDPTKDEHPANHERSQQMLRQILAHRGISSSSEAPCIHGDEERDQDDEGRRRYAFTRMLFDKLKLRGIHGIRHFRQVCTHTDTEESGTMNIRTFEGVLSQCGVRLVPSQHEELVQLYTTDEDTIDYVNVLAHGFSNWSEQRHRVVEEAYDELRKGCPGGFLDAGAIERKFDPRVLTKALIPDIIEHEAAQEFLNQWNNDNLEADGIIRWHDFLDYYLDVSLTFNTDQEFCNFACKSWGINPDDWLATQIFRKYASKDREEALPPEDFKRMLYELDETTTEEEADAWYSAMDEDNNGEVDLQEFLSSKVLKVKRLFDQFDANDERSVGKETMVEILKHLNPAISEEEAEAVYCYADLDNNGDVSFCEFLENNLLQLLHIFDDFDRRRSRSFSEADMKQLLRKLDPGLDDSDIKHIYKAIDVDGSGTIDFIEFCESHVLRAQALFDRYDINRSRSLTQFKFRELLVDLDNSLTTQQMEAIYQMVVDQNDGKVHLGGFLCPNVVKIKMLFDKYDQDRSRYLDSVEFRTMLRDIYKSASEKEIEAIAEVVCPHGSEQGISFMAYIQRFKDIQRKFDGIQLAKKRKAREKARSKGLVLVEE